MTHAKIKAEWNPVADLAAPMQWRTPHDVTISVDLFPGGNPFRFVDRVFAMMALHPQHDFRLTTRNAADLAEYLRERTPPAWLFDFPEGHPQQKHGRGFFPQHWPLPNVHISEVKP